MKRLILALALFTACGGTPASTAKSAAGSTSDGGATEHESIGALAAAQGGIGALGGAGNREEGGATGIEAAMSGLLRADEVKSIKLDGVLSEWRPRIAANETVSGDTKALSFATAVAYDEAKIYVAGEVSDPKLARTAAHAEGDDHVAFTIAFPQGRGTLKAYAIGIWAGKPGESVGAVKWLAGPDKGREVAGARIVEADQAGGYGFEAALPWTSFAEARTTRIGLRASLAYVKSTGVLATGAGGLERPQDLAPLPTAPEQAVVDGLLGAKDLAGTAPKIDAFADIVGDERRERISVFGRFFSICGPGYRRGHQFFWRELAGDIVALEPRDVEGRGKDDLVVRRRVVVAGVAHEVLEVWSLATSDEPKTIFAHEIAIADEGHRITNSIRIGSKEIEVKPEPAVGWDERSFSAQLANDVDPLLLPWGTAKSETYRLDHGAFAKVAAAEAASASATSHEATTNPRAADPATPSVKTGSDLSRQVLDAYLHDQGLPAGTKARFDLEVHVDGDARPERVLLIGRDIVVLGPGFKGGNGYARISLTQFANAEDIAELTARDLTGDGAADLVVRGVRRVKPANGEVLAIDGFFVYRVSSGAIGRVFAIETGRQQGDKRIQGLVQFVPAKNGKGFGIDVRPGAAKGWNEKNYPWPEDRPGGSIEPLLLPWGRAGHLRYAWDGSSFAVAR